jgi:hypothetical protein
VPGPSLIENYRAAVSAQLPAAIVDELADGIAETYRSYLDQGLGPDAAARAAVAEFGEPALVVAAFTRASPARCAARRLLMTGPVVGACWGAVLVAGRAWTWPVPVAARALLGTTLAGAIVLLAVAALLPRYRPARRAATAACAGLAAMDAAAIAAVTVLARYAPLPVLLAVPASAARIAFTTRAMRSVLRP